MLKINKNLGAFSLKTLSEPLQNRVPRVQVLLPLPKQKDTCGCLFCFVVKAEGLEPRNSNVLALLTVNSPVDCLRIELIIKPLPKKAPILRCFFPLCTLFYGDFTCFSHIDKITAHGLFRAPQNRGGFFVK